MGPLDLCFLFLPELFSVILTDEEIDLICFTHTNTHTLTSLLPTAHMAMRFGTLDLEIFD